MKIILWTASYPPDLGGLQTVVKQLADQLAVHGHQVLVIANQRGYKSSEELQDNGVKVIRIRHWSGFGQYKGWKGFFLSIADKLLGLQVHEKLKKIFIDFNPEVINIHFPTVQLKYVDLLASFPNVRLVVSFHGHDVTYWLKNANHMIIPEKRETPSWDKQNFGQLQKLVSAAHSITTCSDWLFLMLKHLLPSVDSVNQMTTHNAVDISRFSESLSEDVATENYIFAFGRLEKHKGFHILIEAFEIIATLNQNIKLMIGGDGIEKSNLKHLIHSKNLDERVHLVGRLNPDEVVRYSRKALVIVVPSLREPFGITVLEALASGRPVVASQVGGITEAAGAFVTLAQPGNVQALADAIHASIVSNERIRMEERIKHLQQFDLSSFYQRYAFSLKLRDGE